MTAWHSLPDDPIDEEIEIALGVPSSKPTPFGSLLHRDHAVLRIRKDDYLDG
jgi:hypothetical protein